MTSDRLFVYGTLMRDFDHPMAQLLSRRADFIGEARCQGRLYLVKHYPGLVLSNHAAANFRRLRQSGLGYDRSRFSTVPATRKPPPRPSPARAGEGASLDFPHQPHIHFALDVGPFLGAAQFTDEVLEQSDMLGRIF